eukprot:TRINITY_DN2879_c0_g1_i1.p3 TRINITY_DN2879_c0_g1~~TRINITY_DN2879_c0_g1_i1.p3  ORF type:complete len:108 (+),score=19.16 TRINITY_DN2879_c0_g1_i1:779-1102(+)
MIFITKEAVTTWLVYALVAIQLLTLLALLLWFEFRARVPLMWRVLRGGDWREMPRVTFGKLSKSPELPEDDDKRSEDAHTPEDTHQSVPLIPRPPSRDAQASFSLKV